VGEAMERGGSKNKKKLCLRDSLLSFGLKNHRDHRVHREKCQRSVLSEDSVVDFPCDEPFLLNKFKNLLLVRVIYFIIKLP